MTESWCSVILILHALAHKLAFQQDGVTQMDCLSQIQSKDRIPNIFKDSRDERGVSVTTIEWFGDPHYVQAHEKFGLSIGPDKEILFAKNIDYFLTQ